MTSPYNARAAYSVSIVAVDRRNLEILMAAAYLFEAMPPRVGGSVFLPDGTATGDVAKARKKLESAAAKTAPTLNFLR